MLHALTPHTINSITHDALQLPHLSLSSSTDTFPDVQLDSAAVLRVAARSLWDVPN